MEILIGYNLLYGGIQFQRGNEIISVPNQRQQGEDIRALVNAIMQGATEREKHADIEIQSPYTHVTAGKEELWKHLATLCEE